MKVNYSGMAENLGSDLKKASEQNKRTLKRCPFCGGEAILESDIVGKGKELWYVSCKSDCVTQYGYSTTKEGAIEKWNKRAPVYKVIERLEEAKLVVEIDDDHIFPESDVDEFFELEVVALSDVIEIIKEMM